MTAANVIRLLDLLCGDDAFREAFSSAPSVAMAQHGLQPLTVAGACMIAGELAPKEEFIRVRNELQQQLARSSVFSHPHFFEAGAIAASLAMQEGAAAA
ncbi:MULTISPECIES: NHLP-related RiPP peptide [Stenotrophomonas]|uniref:NHLP-related RiPP peptide n=1 Tax=Stenotrophomonas TaxID=40323 RepID=UPI0018D40A63|nr:NHLP-related RiPP peptide [Stenotrophomonas sp.]MBH1509155.1 NHLP-related RiPP peptide [Stenotrophomonas maltophilia]